MVEIDKLPTRIFSLADSALAIFPAFRAESLDVLVGQQSAIFSKRVIDCYICKTLTHGRFQIKLSSFALLFQRVLPRQLFS